MYDEDKRPMCGPLAPDTLELLRDAVCAQKRLWNILERLMYKVYPDDESPRTQSDNAFEEFVADLAAHAGNIDEVNSTVTQEDVDRLKVLALRYIPDS